MPYYILSFKPAIGLYGQHDPAAALFEDGELIFGIEEERLTRDKHAPHTFPRQAIQACLDYRDIALSDIDQIVLPYDPQLRSNLLRYYVRDALSVEGVPAKVNHLGNLVKDQLTAQYFPLQQIKTELAQIGDSIPSIRHREHHACHMASAFHPSTFDEAVIFTVDAKGEYDSTVVWHGTEDGYKRIRTYKHPNSWGLFYAIITEYLGYQMFNGEGKLMGLAPYGSNNPDIEASLRSRIETGVDYDVTSLTYRWGTNYGVQQLEELSDRPRKDTPGRFDQWEKDLAYTAQKLLEESMCELVHYYCNELNVHNVCLAGGVMLNCKLNQRISNLPTVEGVFIQPIAHDAGLVLGAGWIGQQPSAVKPMKSTYFGPSYENDDIRELLTTNKVEFTEPDSLERTVAEHLADGDLVGWFQGRLEMGPRALGNRSILADPRSVESRDRVNKYVKHREEWRPFAPSLLEEAACDYLATGKKAPFMIQTFDTVPEKQTEISAVLHPADYTTRPQTVCEEQNPRYYRLLSEFAGITGIPVVLNTSFNDHAEPIVTTPSEALKDFFGMGLDVLAIEDLIVTK